ncbi:hypothetical protein M9H77_23329 [Catharanthus roseus]|uniref:Uncharacterized protein n=1 Tax=Catharanthus roseus TaxID=4058 RepID=A0ACC0AX16_CATRO|nr:hypothetical protein M9H77_23329 [Catharanthus roseus]
MAKTVWSRIHVLVREPSMYSLVLLLAILFYCSKTTFHGYTFKQKDLFPVGKSLGSDTTVKNSGDHPCYINIKSLLKTITKVKEQKIKKLLISYKNQDEGAK